MQRTTELSTELPALKQRSDSAELALKQRSDSAEPAPKLRDDARPDTLIEDWDNLPATPAHWAEGKRIGPFLLKRQLGQGGMGLVWLAEQQEPLLREVAIKVMLRESQSRLAEAYFEIERQAQARLNHRAIAQIYDAGKLPNGALFFAMEYVPGLALHSFLQANKTDAKRLAKLMIEICLGVQHAHQRGLIHRDIKPGNILVTEIDGVIQPKIIDFGIAVASRTVGESGTRVIDAAGTEAYMSPEQRTPGADGIDVRTDVYALGAVLAESSYVLAGLAVDHAGAASTKWHGEINASVKQRNNQLPKDCRRLATVPVEIRAIALKAMAPAREDRYQSASAMAEDLARWLQAEPVLAMGGGRAYQLRCLVRRHALASAVAGLVLLAIVVGVVMTLYGLREARIGRAQAEAAFALAEQRRHEAEGLVEFMLGDFAQKLRTIGRLDMLEDVGNKALDYLAKEKLENTEASAMQHASAYRTLAGVQIARNQNDTAQKTLIMAEAKLMPWIHSSKNAELLDLASDIAFRQGRLSFAKDDLLNTERHWLEQLRLARLASSLAPQSSETQKRVSNALLNMAVFETHPQRGQGTKALGYLDESIKLKAKLVEAGDKFVVRELANAWAWRASVLQDLGRDREAWANQQQAVAVLAQDPIVNQVDANRMSMEAEIRLQMALSALDLGLEQQAQQILKRALELSSAVMAVDTTDIQARGGLVRIALQTALVSPDSAAIDARYRAVIDQCLSQTDCNKRFANALQMMDLQLRLKLRKNVGPSEFSTLVSSILTQAPIKLELLRRAIELAQRQPQLALGAEAKAELAKRFDEVSPALQSSLRYTLSRLALLRLQNPQSTEIAALEQTIQTRRRSVADWRQ